MTDRTLQPGSSVAELVAQVDLSGFHRLLPDDLPAEPAPYPGCPVCAALVGQRAEARFGRGSLTVWECDRELRTHPHRRSGDYT